MTAISARIKDWREQHGLTREEARKVLGCSQPTIWAWETGNAIPSMASIRRIAKKMKAPMETMWREASDAALARAGQS